MCPRCLLQHYRGAIKLNTDFKLIRWWPLLSVLIVVDRLLAALIQTAEKYCEFSSHQQSLTHVCRWVTSSSLVCTYTSHWQMICFQSHSKNWILRDYICMLVCALITAPICGLRLYCILLFHITCGWNELH